MPRIALTEVALYYEITGQGKPILFIHGLGSSGRDWEYQVEAFGDKYQVVTCDVRGHGRSDKPPGPYSVQQFAKDAAELVRMLHLESLHVVGISMGGMIAFQLAVSAPHLVRSLVIANSAPELVVRTISHRLQLLQRILIVRLLGMRKMGEVLAGRLLPKAEHFDLRVLFAERWAENDPRAYLNSMRALVNWSVTSQLPNITCPTLVIASDQDYTPVAAKQAYVDMMPNARLAVIEDARHALPVERPEQFNQVLAGFLTELN